MWLVLGCLILAVQLALRILPDLESFKVSSEFASIDQRLAQAGLLIFHASICHAEEVIELDDDLLLVAGSVRNQVSKCIYEAPSFINHSLGQQGLKLLEGRSMTKMLVLPRDPTEPNKPYLFTNRPMIRYMLDEYIQRNALERFTLDERQQTNPNQASTEPYQQRPINLRNSINERHERKTVDMNRLLLATGNPDIRLFFTETKPSLWWFSSEHLFKFFIQSQCHAIAEQSRYEVDADVPRRTVRCGDVTQGHTLERYPISFRAQSRNRGVIIRVSNELVETDHFYGKISFLQRKEIVLLYDWRHCRTMKIRFMAIHWEWTFVIFIIASLNRVSIHEIRYGIHETGRL